MRTKEHNKKISNALKGKTKSLSHRKNISKSAKKRMTIPENNPNYKGDKVGYIGIHIWLIKVYGLAKHCEKCLKVGKKKNNKWTIEWALRHGYVCERKRENFIKLCKSCHRKYDNTKEWRENISKSKRNKNKENKEENLNE